jgi:hypothetical protein
VENDEWGRDPAVRQLRRIFGVIEAGQQRLLDRLGIDRLDARLGQWRRMTLHLFEEQWAASAQQGLRLEEKDVGDLYLRCMARVLGTRGIGVPADAMAANEKVERLMGGAK